MDYTFEGNRVILETQLQLGFEGAQITCDMEAKPPDSYTQSLVCSLLQFLYHKMKLMALLERELKSSDVH